MTVVHAGVLWDVLEEHLQEAGFLWSQWEQALVSPRYTLFEVQEGPEERLLAHLDGLTEAPNEVVKRLLEPALVGDDETIAFAAASAWLSRDSAQALFRVVNALEAAAPAVRDALGRAVELSRAAGLDAQLKKQAGSAIRKAPVILDALRIRSSVEEKMVELLATSDEPGALSSALRAAGTLGRSEIRALVEKYLDSSVPNVREAAIESGLRLGLRSAWLACRTAVDGKKEGVQLPLLALALSGESAELTRIEKALAEPKLRRPALFALGYNGWTRAADLCLEHMNDASLARVAGEAFSMITGLQIDGIFVGLEPPEQDPLPPLEEEDLQASLIPSPDAELPLPDVDQVRFWWGKARKQFDSETRYLSGKPFSVQTLLETFLNAPMRRRAAWALELAIRSKGEFQIECRDWARAQRCAQERPFRVLPASRMSFSNLLTH